MKALHVLLAVLLLPCFQPDHLVAEMLVLLLHALLNEVPGAVPEELRAVVSVMHLQLVL